MGVSRTVGFPSAAISSSLFTARCVLKPLGLSASRGAFEPITRSISSPRSTAFEALLARPEIQVLREEQSRYIQVESFITGKEYALEGLLIELAASTISKCRPIQARSLQ